MLKLSLECTRLESNYSSCTSRTSERIYVATAEALRKKERLWMKKLSSAPKLVEKLVWVPLTSFRYAGKF
jgi:hypothetical protein